MGLVQLGVEHNPSMRQYVDLLELVCESESQATGLILQDVSIIYAKLGGLAAEMASPIPIISPGRLKRI